MNLHIQRPRRLRPRKRSWLSSIGGYWLFLTNRSSSEASGCTLWLCLQRAAFGRAVAGLCLAVFGALGPSVASAWNTNPPPGCAGCAVAYPYASTNPLTSIAFNESAILRAFNTNLVSTQDTIRAWYNDERALLLGIRRVIVKTPSGSTTNDYPVTPLVANPGSFTNPAVGTIASSGDQAGTDITNRPIFPALFITDTTSDPLSRSGDWQFGGTPIPPHAVFGTWKAAVRTVDHTRNPATVTVTADADPARNGWNLGAGDPAPPGLPDEGYGAEVRWNVADLGLQPGHSYRLYFMIHDGDQNKAGGDAGQGCVNITVVSAIGPANRTNCPGDTVVFTTIVSSVGTYTFSWLKNGILLPNQTTNTLTLTNISASDAGIYTAIVSSQCGNVTNSASLTVNATVSATALTSLSRCPGQSAGFSTVASGTGPFSYVWEKDNAIIAGQTSSSLTIASVSLADAGRYSVIVSGACGRVTNDATLTVNQPVVILDGPVSLTNCPGTRVIFTVNATGASLSYQWRHGTNLLSGQTTNTLILTNVSAADAGTYSVTVSGACGNSVTSSASLTVNSNVIVSSGPMSLTNCPGTLAIFTVNATGTGLSYQWYKESTLLAGQTTNTLILTNVTAADAATYSVVISGACNTLTNTARLTLNAATAATPLVSVIRNLGDSVTFTTIASGTGLFTYVWKKDGSIIPGQTASSLTLTNLGFADGAVYTVEVTGACNTAIQSATLTINIPPTVAIVSPTNGSVFIAPATFMVRAEAHDVDGYVTRVDFFQGGSFVGSSTNAEAFFVVRTNLPIGSYTFTAIATDNLNATGTSAPVSVTVIQHVPLTVIGPIRLNYQTGLYEQTARISNPTPFRLGAVGVLVYDLPAHWRLQNPSFVTNGVSGVLYNQPLLPGASADVTLKYYLAAGSTTNASPTLVAIEMPPASGANAVGTSVPIIRQLALPDGTFLLHFRTVSNATYFVLYGEDLVNWKTSPAPIQGDGHIAQWIDYGPPATESLPGGRPGRFYRVVQVP